MNQYANTALIDVEPSAPNHYVTMDWVTQFTIGKIKLPVRAISTANIAGAYVPGTTSPFTRGVLTRSTNGALTIDGVAVLAGERVALVGQSAGLQNGIWTVLEPGNAGAPSRLERADDWDTSDQLYHGVRLHVREGTLYANTTWALTTSGALTLDTTALSFAQVGTATGTSKFCATITGNAVATAFNVAHNLGTKDVVIEVYDPTTDESVGVDIKRADANNATITFGSAPTGAMSFRVVVVG